MQKGRRRLHGAGLPAALRWLSRCEHRLSAVFAQLPQDWLSFAEVYFYFYFYFLLRGSLLRVFIRLAQVSSKDFAGHALMVYSLLLLEPKNPSIRELRGATKSSLSQIPAAPFSYQAFPHTPFLPSSLFSHFFYCTDFTFSVL